MLYSPWFILLVGLTPAHSQQAVSTQLIDDSYEYSPNQPDGIQYSSNWNAVSGPTTTSRYNSTFHLSNTPETNAVYFFRGNSTYYYSDRGPLYTRALVTVDGEESAYVNASAPSSQYQQLLWNRTNLGPGDHQVIVTHRGTEGYSIGLDYFRVESDHGFVPESAGPNASVVPANAVFVDDTYSVTYSSNWATDHSSNLGSAFFNNSLTKNQHPGSWATFQFHGTAVWYFSDTDSTHGNVRVELNGKHEDTISGYSSVQLAQRLLWSKTNIPPGLHTLILTHNGTDDQLMTLDFFRYLPSEALDSTPEPRSQTLMIAGIISGVIFVAILILGWFYYRRRKSAQCNALNKTDLLDEDGHPDPAYHLSFVSTPYQTPADQVPPRGNKVVPTPAQDPSSYASSSVWTSTSAPSGSSRARYTIPQASPPPYAQHPIVPNHH